MRQLSSFRAQLLLLVIGLLSFVLSAVFIAVNQANEKNARRHLEESLSITAVAFQRSLAARNHILIDKARLLSGDYAFKEAVATNDYNTILSALENHRRRVKASVMMLAKLDGELIANTLNNKQNNAAWELEVLQKNAEESPGGEASGILLLQGEPYQLVIMPLFTPEPSAWIVIGFKITDVFSQRLAEQTNSDVSLAYKKQSTHWALLSSTLDSSQHNDLLQSIKSLGENNHDSVTDVILEGDPYLTMILSIQRAGKGQTLAILQRSLEEALKPYLRLRNIMLLLFGIGLAIAVVSAYAIAYSLARPLEALTQSVKQIDSGDYQNIITLERNDELGTLSSAIKHMSEGLQERDEVRDLLGKVVSPQIATELLSKKIELGGEDRFATILFSDIREFTTLCEDREPKSILNLLNRYLSSMTHVIEAHHGVIDKYIGDAIMALFGVPIGMDDTPEHAVKSAIEMVVALKRLNEELEKEGAATIHIGIGINSGQVVAGNMGSLNRLNYTVIGDSVNLASRLEGLTCYFGVPIIVSESTAVHCKNIDFRDLGTVQVKGKEENVQIFTPLLIKDFSAEQTKRLEQYHQALAAFRQKKWDKTQQQFEQLLKMTKVDEVDDFSALYHLYLENIELCRKRDLSDDWNGELVFLQK